MKSKIKIWVLSTALPYILMNWFRVKMEYLFPASWKVVDDLDMLKFVTSANTLILKSSEANHFKPQQKDILPGEYSMHMYNDSSQLVFLFDNKISRTENNNLRGAGMGKTFKYKLIIIHGWTVTKLIKKVLKYNTNEILKALKEHNLKNPIKGDFKSQMEFELAKPHPLTRTLTNEELKALGNVNIVESDGYKEAIIDESNRFATEEQLKSSEIDKSNPLGLTHKQKREHFNISEQHVKRIKSKAAKFNEELDYQTKQEIKAKNYKN